MLAETMTIEVALSHQGKCYRVTLVQWPSGQWTWSYALWNRLYTNGQEGVDDSGTALMQAKAAAEAQLDLLVT